MNQPSLNSQLLSNQPSSNQQQVTYFIADLHLAQNRPDITACFLRFLKEEAVNIELNETFDVINLLKSLQSANANVTFKK